MDVIFITFDKSAIVQGAIRYFRQNKNRMGSTATFNRNMRASLEATQLIWALKSRVNNGKYFEYYKWR